MYYSATSNPFSPPLRLCKLQPLQINNLPVIQENNFRLENDTENFAVGEGWLVRDLSPLISIVF